MGLLDEGTPTLQLAADRRGRGAARRRRQQLQRRRPFATSMLNALSPNLAPSLDLMADVVRRPGVPARRHRAHPRPAADRHRPAAEGPDAGRQRACCRRCSTAPTHPYGGPRRAAIRRRSKVHAATIWSPSSDAGCGPTMRKIFVVSRPAAGRGPAAARGALRQLARARRRRRASRRSRRSPPRPTARGSCSSTGRARRSR